LGSQLRQLFMIDIPGRGAAPPAGQDESSKAVSETHRPEPTSAIDERIRRHLWMLVCCLALMALTFVDRPGKIIADTKLDMAINPIGFLERATHLWDPAQFGQLQNQATGYFFPMGPFFALGKLAALPPWVIQRLWLTAVLLAAFIGVTKLIARFGIGSPMTQLVGGLVYALAPRELGELGAISIELLPAAMVPWIMLPLVRVVQESRSGSPRPGLVRPAARSAAAVALCSGVNAAAVVAAVLPALIYLWTVPRPVPRWRFLAWWAPMIVLVSWIWLVPLLLLQGYGVSLLPYTESAAVTTSATSLSNTFRGTEDWVSYLFANGHTWWPLAFWTSNAALPTIATGLIAGLGLAGLLGMRAPSRRPLLCILLTGVVIVLIGYRSGLGSPLAPALDHLINGPLAPFRNVRKFDPLIRLPVAVGVAHLLARARRASALRAVRLAAALAMVITTVPAYIGGLSPAGDFQSIPQYWDAAASWLNRHAGNQAVLEVPGAQFGEYTWGRPMDDVLEPLFSGAWATRQLSSIGSVGNDRLLDAIDQQLAAGAGSTGLSQVLARMGVKYLVVRNDLLRDGLDGAWPARIHQAISESPGLVKVATFGSYPVGSFYPDTAISNFDSPYLPVEIYQVRGAEPTAVVLPAASVMRVYGGPEALLSLADQGLLRGRPVLLNSDSPAIATPWNVVTDSLRRRVRNFGQLRNDYSPTLTAAQQASTFEAVPDYLEPGWQRYESVAQYFGISNVSASSSDASITAIPTQSATGLFPYSAVDGDLRTMWESGALTGPVGQWIKVDFAQAVNTGTVRIAFVNNNAMGPPVTAVSIATAAGTVADRVRVTGQLQSLAVAPGPTTWLRVTVTRTRRSASPAIGRQVGIAEIVVPGVSASRTIVAPNVALAHGADPSAVVLAKAEPQPTDCMLTSMRWVCSPQLMKATEEQYGFDESFPASRSWSGSLSGSAVLTQVGLIARYAWGNIGQPQVTGSPAYSAEPQDQPQSAFDDNPLTTWVAGIKNKTPKLTIRWARARTVSQVTITRPSGAAGPMPVLLTGSKGQVRGGIVTGQAATLKFAPMRTRSLRFWFTPPVLPLQITDIQIPRVRPLESGGQAPFALPCGFGPRIQINGQYVPTRATGTYEDVLTGQPLHFAACDAVPVSGGINRVIEPSWDAFDVQAVVLEPPGDQAFTQGSTVGFTSPRVISWTSSSRVLHVAASQPSYLVVNENFNRGWTASYDHHALQPLRLDGWQQAWSLPAGTAGTVTLTFSPDATYRANLPVAFAAIVVVFVVALVPTRRRRLRHGRYPAAEASLQAPTEPADQGRSAGAPKPRRAVIGSASVLLLGTGAVSAAGLWLGGYPGALVLPLATAAFVAALALSTRSARWRLASSPWLVTGLLAIAAIVGAVGVQLRNAGHGGALVRALWHTCPQVLCLIVVARLIAALVATVAERES
jgi:arabinofuranan 3-O-arabinosyltransferase